jgi:RNA polymerase sigma-70 factor (ECF subfamily)
LLIEGVNYWDIFALCVTACRLLKKPGMIRITTDTSRGSRLIVEGRLSGRAVDELLENCANLSAAGTVLDISGVMFADRFAAILLCKLNDAGLMLEGCSGFIQELLRETRQRSARTDNEETRLIHGLRTGDGEAFELLARSYGGRMMAAARRILQNESDARDALQEAFLSVFQSIGNFAGEAALGTWLHRIVVNAALMQIRSRRRRSEEPIEQLLPRFDQSGDWAEEGCQSTRVDDLQESRELIALVRKCLDKLPERYRTVLMLRDIEDFDTKQTARMLNTTPTAVKVRLHRARQALKTLVEREVGNVGVAGRETPVNGP